MASVTGSFILDYYLLVFLASCGVFQMVGAWKALAGMLYLKHRSASFLLGFALLVGSFTWFFLSESRNVPDSAHGMNGNEQFAYFFAGLGTALAFTLFVSSLINWKLATDRPKLRPGLDALKQSGYLRIIYRTRPYFEATMVPENSMIESTSKIPNNLSSSSSGKLPLRLKIIARFLRQTRQMGAFR